MNINHSQTIINNLLEENRKLKQLLNNRTVINTRILDEKLNFIRFIFSVFENFKNHPLSSIALFGPFLENFISNRPINELNLSFYLKERDPNQIIKFLNILNNIDYIERINKNNILLSTTNILAKYGVCKNNIKFSVVIFSPTFEKYSNIQFDIQNIEFDSVMDYKISA